jgi:SH3 domain-containing YSC84-like protein 1
MSQKSPMNMSRRRHILRLIAGVALGLVVGPVWGQFRAVEVVHAATAVLEETLAAPAGNISSSTLDGARGIAIIPSLRKGGVLVGVQYGHGVTLVRDSQGVWQPPSFINLNGWSLGTQVGYQDTGMVLVFKTPESLRLRYQFVLTAGAGGDTTAKRLRRETTGVGDAALLAEVYPCSASHGLAGWVSLSGTGIAIDHQSNLAYYGAKQPPVLAAGQEIALPPSATRLLACLNRSPAPGAGPSADQSAAAFFPPTPFPRTDVALRQSELFRR